jgi:hypothetical protein
VTFLVLLCSINGKTYAPVNLDRIAHWVEQGRLQSSPDKPITARELVLSGCIHNAHDGVKLLGNVRALVVCFRLLPYTLVSPGFGTSQSADTHYTISRLQVRHSSRREARRLGFLQILQPVVIV